MAALDIQPHSRRISGMAVAVLMLVAAGSFTVGLTHQMVADAATTERPQTSASAQAYAAIPEATPAPNPQLAAGTAPHRKAAPDPEPEPQPLADEPTAPPTAEAAPAVDAAATAPEPPPPSDEAPPTP
jgi:hypothetical protein